MLELRAEVDVDRLELAAADARRVGTPAAYRAALSLYGGELPLGRSCCQQGRE